MIPTRYIGRRRSLLGHQKSSSSPSGYTSTDLPNGKRLCHTSKPIVCLRITGRWGSLLGHQRHRRLPETEPRRLGLGGWNMPHLGFPVLDPGGMFFHEQRHHVLVLRGTLPPCGCRRCGGLHFHHLRQVIPSVCRKPLWVDAEDGKRGPFRLLVAVLKPEEISRTSL